MLVLALVLGALLRVGRAQENPAAERISFEAAARAFQDGAYNVAERAFAGFIQQFPTSTRRPEAVLLQARSMLNQQQMDAAIKLLQASQGNAGALADRYQYWMAEAYRFSTNYQAAAEAFAKMAVDHPQSNRLLEAGYGEALARFRLKEWPVVIDLLQRGDGAFRMAAQARPNDPLVARGELLLAEALLELRRLDRARAVLDGLSRRELPPDFQWRRLFLDCQVLLANGRGPDALVQSTNLVQMAVSIGQAEFLAESRALQGRILEETGALDAATLAYEANLAEDVPVGRRREALLKVIQLMLDLGRYEDASRRLDAFFEQYPGDRDTDVGLLTYGELHLKQALGRLGTNVFELPSGTHSAVSNQLAIALSRFQELIAVQTNSTLLGRAHLDSGWCLWLQGQVGPSREQFAAAEANLPFSYDRAVAIFKEGDAAYLLEDYTNALANYEAVVGEYVEMSEVRELLLDRALYQVIRSSLALHRLPRATAAMEQLLSEQPDSPLADRAMLVVGQASSRLGQPVEARRILKRCADQYPNRSLRPEVMLAVARSYVLETNWTEAIAQYQSWMQAFPSDPRQSTAEFNLAWATAQSGDMTNALTLFTRFADKHPNDALVPNALFWVADYHFNNRDFLQAQRLYQETNLLVSPFAYRARMMAGLSAFAGERWTDAIDNFKAIINATPPPDVEVEALFGLGDTYIRQSANQSQPTIKFLEAIAVFQKVPQLHPGHPRVAQAWGRIGDCHFTLAGSDPSHYAAATNAYLRVLEMPGVSPSTRNQTDVRLAMLEERMATALPDAERKRMQQAALDRYLNVVYGNGAALATSPQPDPYWLKEAGLAAGRLAEDLGQWELAINLYERLLRVLPPMRPVLERRLQRARELQETSEGGA